MTSFIVCVWCAVPVMALLAAWLLARSVASELNRLQRLIDEEAE
jgi:hypothetical protein